MRFDGDRRPACKRYALDHVGIERALRQEIGAAELFRFRLEHIDEEATDRLALELGIGDAGQRIEEIRRAGLYDDIWQAFAVILPVKTVGVMGDGRTYEYVVGLRAVTSTDGMTADFYSFEMKFLGETATRIINEVKGVNRVVYDVTSKPPGTIEWE